MKFYVDYFGCRSNQAEAQEWIIQLENSGYQYTTTLADADFALLNTCCVTEQAERDLARYLRKNYQNTRCPWFVVGCAVSKGKDTFSQGYKDYFFFDNREKETFLERIREIFPPDANLIYHSAFKSRFFLKVQEGCNFRCSFCIVPFVRGKSRSLPREEVLRKAKYYVSLGYREILLTGINLSSYGYDLFPRENLLSLIQDVHEIRGLEILRLSSLDPRFIKYEFIKELSMLPKLADSFHFSLQSGSDSILKAMKRVGKSFENQKNITLFRKFFPDANLGADIIIGFPGEGENDFKKTVLMFAESELNYLHIFPFSSREGTAASNMIPVAKEIVMRRMRELRDLNTKKKLEFREKMIGKTLEGIVIEENPCYSLVLSKSFISIRIPPLRGYKKRKMRVGVTRVINENLCEGRVW